MSRCEVDQCARPLSSSFTTKSLVPRQSKVEWLQWNDSTIDAKRMTERELICLGWLDRPPRFDPTYRTCWQSSIWQGKEKMFDFLIWICFRLSKATEFDESVQSATMIRNTDDNNQNEILSKETSQAKTHRIWSRFLFLKSRDNLQSGFRLVSKPNYIHDTFDFSLIFCFPRHTRYCVAYRRRRGSLPAAEAIYRMRKSRITGTICGSLYFYGALCTDFYRQGLLIPSQRFKTVEMIA